MDSNAGINSLMNALPPELGGKFGTEAAPPPTQPTPAAPEPQAEVKIEPPVKEPTLTRSEAPLKKGADAFDIEEEPAKEAPKAEEDSEEPPADAKTPEAKNAWTKSRNEIKELKAALETLRAEKEKADTELAAKKGLVENDPIKAEYERLKVEREEWQKEAAKYRIEQTDAYKEAVTKPLQSLSKFAEDIATRNEVDKSRLFDALRETDEKRQNEKISEIVESMSERDKLRVWNIADELGKIYAKQDELESNALAALTEAQQREAEAASKKQIEMKAAEMRAVEDLRPKLAKAAHLFALDGEDAETAIGKILSEANAVPFNEHDNDAKAFAVVSSAILPRLMRNLQAAVKERDSLKREIAEYSGSSARMTDGAKKPAQTSAAPQGFDAVMAGIQADLAKMGIR